MNFISNWAKSPLGNIADATGNVTKAYLCVRNAAGYKTGDDPSALAKASDEAQKAILKRAAEKMKGGDLADHIGAERILKSKASGSSSSKKVLSYDELSDVLSGAGNAYIPIQVQYNPSTLQYHSDLGGRRRISQVEGVGAGGDGQSIKDIPKNTELSCTLVFEKINVNDAFIQASEGWNASIGNVTSTVGDAVKKLTGGSNSEPYSVRKEVEGFLSILSTMYTRDVIFFYGKICFHGEITFANATYKMFNKKGDPIYAEVAIRIRQNNLNHYDRGRWKDSFDAIFNGEGDMANPAGVSDTFSEIGNVFSGGIF